jgi:predicted ATPase
MLAHVNVSTPFLTLCLQGFLSFAPASDPVELGPLNVLIGPNGSGKSNFLEAFSLLHALPSDLPDAVREGGGVLDFVWKGDKGRAKVQPVIEAVVEYPSGHVPLRYRLKFSGTTQQLLVTDERIENASPDPGHDKPFFYYGYENGIPTILTRAEPDSSQARPQRRLSRDSVDSTQSILSQRRDPDLYPELTYLSRLFGGIHLYREWNLGRGSTPRLPQRPDLPEDFLLEEGANLGLIINSLQHSDSWSHIMSNLRLIYDNISDLSVRIHAGTVQVYLHEKGLREPIPATRISDGTLRYLMLLAILLHPDPPPLLCLEEPEIGLHPEVIPILARLLQDASLRSQIVVTTHSDILVDALSSSPEAILVCDKVDSATTLKRLDSARLSSWLEEYKLGDLWKKGEIGGTRW